MRAECWSSECWSSGQITWVWGIVLKLSKNKDLPKCLCLANCVWLRFILRIMPAALLSAKGLI